MKQQAERGGRETAKRQIGCRGGLSAVTVDIDTVRVSPTYYVVTRTRKSIRCRNGQRLLVLSRKVVFCLTGPYLNKAGDHIGRLANWRLARIRAFSVVSLGACASALSADLLVVVIGIHVSCILARCITEHLPALHLLHHNAFRIWCI